MYSISIWIPGASPPSYWSTTPISSATWCKTSTREGAPPSDQLDLDEAELVVVRIDHVVRDAGRARIGGARFEPHVARARGFLQAQEAAGERHHHIVVRMHVISGVLARLKAPFGDDHAIVLHLFDGGCSRHMCPVSRAARGEVLGDRAVDAEAAAVIRAAFAAGDVAEAPCMRRVTLTRQ